MANSSHLFFMGILGLTRLQLSPHCFELTSHCFQLPFAFFGLLVTADVLEDCAGRLFEVLQVLHCEGGLPLFDVIPETAADKQHAGLIGAHVSV